MSHFAGINNSQIFIHVVGNPPNQIIKSIKELGANIVRVDPYKDHPYCNKLQQLKSLETVSFSDVVLLDCDTIVLEEPPSLPGGALGKPVDFDNPPIRIIENIFNRAGVKLQAWSRSVRFWLASTYIKANTMSAHVRK